MKFVPIFILAAVAYEQCNVEQIGNLALCEGLMSRNVREACTHSRAYLHADALSAPPASQLFEITAWLTSSNRTRQFLDQPGPIYDASWDRPWGRAGWLFWGVAIEIVIWLIYLMVILLRRRCQRHHHPPKPPAGPLVFLASVIVTVIMSIIGIAGVARYGPAFVYDAAATPCTFATIGRDLLFESHRPIYPKFHGLTGLHLTLKETEQRGHSAQKFIELSAVNPQPLADYLVESMIATYLWTDRMLWEQEYTGWMSHDGTYGAFNLGLYSAKAARLRAAMRAKSRKDAISVRQLAFLLAAREVSTFAFNPAAAGETMTNLTDAAKVGQRSIEKYFEKVMEYHNEGVDFATASIDPAVRNVFRWHGVVTILSHIFIIMISVGIIVYIHYLVSAHKRYRKNPPFGLHCVTYTSGLLVLPYLLLAGWSFWWAHDATDICKTVRSDFIDQALYQDYEMTRGLPARLVTACLSADGDGDLTKAAGWNAMRMTPLSTATWNLRSALSDHLGTELDVQGLQDILSDSADDVLINSVEKESVSPQGLNDAALTALTGLVNTFVEVDYPYRFCITPRTCPGRYQSHYEVVYLNTSTVYRYDALHTHESPEFLAKALGRDERVRNAFPTDPSRAMIFAEAIYLSVLRAAALQPLIRHWNPNKPSPQAYFDPCPVGTACPIFYKPIDLREYMPPVARPMSMSVLQNYEEWVRSISSHYIPSLQYVRTIDHGLHLIDQQLEYVDPLNAAEESIKITSRRSPCSIAREQLLRGHHRVCSGLTSHLTAFGWSCWMVGLAAWSAFKLSYVMVHHFRAVQRYARYRPPITAVARILDASAKGNLAVIQQVIASGVDLQRCVDSSSNTPLHLAAYFGHPHCIPDLIAAGCDPKATNKAGQDAIAMARSNPKVDRALRKDVLKALGGLLISDM